MTYRVGRSPQGHIGILQRRLSIFGSVPLEVRVSAPQTHMYPSTHLYGHTTLLVLMYILSLLNVTELL